MCNTSSCGLSWDSLCLMRTVHVFKALKALIQPKLVHIRQVEASMCKLCATTLESSHTRERTAACRSI